MSGFGNRVLVLLVAALLPVFVLGSVLVVGVARYERQRAEADARAHVEALLTRLDKEIESHLRTLEVLAASPLLDGGDLGLFREYARRAQAREPFWRNILLANADGTQVLNARFPDPAAPVRIGQPETFEAVLRSGRPVIGGVVKGPRSGVMAIPVRVPVLREGKTRFVLTAAIELTALAHLVREVLPKGWSGVIVDREGRIVARTSDGHASAGQPASRFAREAVAARRDGEFRRSRSREGDEYAVLFLRSPLTGWTVHAGFPAASFSILQTRSVALAAGGALASLLLAALLSWLVLRETRLRRRQETALLEGQHWEALGRITGGVAHDFNNLLMIVQGGAQAIKRRRADQERVAAYADAMLAAVQRGSALIRHLLAYARRGAHAPSSFDLKDRAPDLLMLLKQSARGNIETTLSIPDGAWPIYADPNALEIALINLAANARDAMPGGGRLSIAAANVSLRDGHDEGTGLKGDYVVVSVTDTGSGIAEEHIDHVFEPFYTTKPGGQGTGLGLSQVQGFCKQSGGTVTVASRPGHGTTFKLYLPRSSDPARRAPPPGEAPPPGGGGRALLVEDNAEVARAIESMLASAGYAVTSAGSAALALEALRREGPFDVVLSDIVMEGGMSGLDLAAHLRAQPGTVPIVLMTGYSDALVNGRTRGLQVLAKPFQQDELEAALRTARLASAPP